MKHTHRSRSEFFCGLTICMIAALAAGTAQAQSGTQNRPSGSVSSDNRSTTPPANEPTPSVGQTANERAATPGDSAAANQRGDSAAGNQHGDHHAASHNAIGVQFDAAEKGGQGLKIASVDPNGPAGQAGLQANDRVLAVDGRAFTSARHLNAYLSAQAGRPVPFQVERNGQHDTVELFPTPSQSEGAFLGVFLEDEVQNPNAPQRPGQNIAGQNAGQNAAGPKAGQNGEAASTAKGARITQVFPTSPAARAGLRPGDAVVQINGQKIDDAAELISAVHEMKPQSKADFVVLRDNQEVKVPVTLGGRNSFALNGAGPGPDAGNFAAPGQFRGNPQVANFPPHMMQLEHDRRVAEQHQRIEDEIRALRDEVKQLRQEIQQQHK